MPVQGSPLCTARNTHHLNKSSHCGPAIRTNCNGPVRQPYRDNGDSLPLSSKQHASLSKHCVTRGRNNCVKADWRSNKPVCQYCKEVNNYITLVPSMHLLMPSNMYRSHTCFGRGSKDTVWWMKWECHLGLHGRNNNYVAMLVPGGVLQAGCSCFTPCPALLVLILVHLTFPVSSLSLCCHPTLY